MKSVLMSIHPKWCALIASGKKTVEVRKTKPKLQTPFKVYIYCTKGKPTFTQSAFCDEVSNGKVIGEFVCDRIDELSVPYPAYFSEIDSKTESNIKSACLKPIDIHAYNGTHQTYGWHISDLVIYDEPRELSKFHITCADIKNCLNRAFRESGRSLDKCFDCGCKITRPPQSWCYVEEVE